MTVTDAPTRPASPDREGGAVVELAAGAARLRIAPALGGRVTRLWLEGRDGGATDVLLPFPEETPLSRLLRWPKGGIYPLVPYGNRIRDARLRFGGREHRLPSHPDAAPHTLHGHAHRVPWRLAARTATSAEWRLDHAGGGEWPWPFAAAMTADLAPGMAGFTLSLRNAATIPMPAGLGLHPYLAYAPFDRLSFRTGLDWPATPDLLAGSPVPLAGGDDLAGAMPGGSVTLYRSGWDGVFELGRADGPIIRVEADPIFGHLVVHRPEAARYLCPEPATHAPDGFNLSEAGTAGAGRIVLQPGETVQGRVAISLR